MKEPITQEQFYEDMDREVERLVNWFKQTESPTDACKDFIYEIVTQLGESHFTTVGILTELLLQWRDASDRALKEMEEDNDDENNPI